MRARGAVISDDAPIKLGGVAHRKILDDDIFSTNRAVYRLARYVLLARNRSHVHGQQSVVKVSLLHGRVF